MKLGKHIRKDFPIYSRVLEPDNLVYLDSAATSLKPKRVIDAVRDYYESYSVNVDRGVYSLAGKATAAYEESRRTIAQFIGASRPEEVVFVRNATEALNLIAYSFAPLVLKEGDGILLTEMEHHANLVPWQQLADRNHFRIFFLPFDVQTGELEWDKKTFDSFLKERKIKLLSLTHVSNVLGTVNPVVELAKIAKEAGVYVVADGSQSVPHMPVHVGELGADFFVFSGHKMLGPTGIGILWGRYGMLNRMPPFLTGGEMILDVGWEKSTFREPPWRFEAGTPHIAGAIGLGEAVRYLQEIGMSKVMSHEHNLMGKAISAFSGIAGLHILGPQDKEQRSGVLSFIIEGIHRVRSQSPQATADVHAHQDSNGIHAHDVGSFLDERGIMIRVGDHCARPLHKKFKIPASSRISFSIYNDVDDIEKAARALGEMTKLFRV